MKNIVYVVLNRLHSERFPELDTIEEVVFDKNQFQPVSNGLYWEVEITNLVREAVDEAYADYSETNNAQGALFFKADYCKASWSGKKYLFTDKVGHEFYK